MSRKIIAWLLSVMVVISMTPAMVFADPDPAAQEGLPETQTVVEAETDADADAQSAAKTDRATDAQSATKPAAAAEDKAAEPEGAAKSESAAAPEETGTAGPAYPAQTLKGKSGDVTVTLKAPEGSLPEGAALNVSAVKSADVRAAVKEELESQGKVMNAYVALDVTPVDADGREIQPQKPVTVTFSGTDLDAGEDSSFEVFRVSDDADTVTVMETTVAKADKQTFGTDHFTIYVSTGSVDRPNGEQGSGPNDSYNQYIVKNGETIELKSDLQNQGNDPWIIKDSYDKQFAELTEGTDNNCFIKNNNPNAGDGNIVIQHSWHNSSGTADGYENYYITLEGVKYDVSFKVKEPGSDTFTDAGTVSVRKGYNASQPADIEQIKTVDGKQYRLDGWYTDETLQTEASLQGVQGDMTVYGSYIGAAYSVHYEKVVENDLRVPADQAAEEGESVTLGSINQESFRGWNTEQDGTGDAYAGGQTIEMPDHDLTLYAQWEYTLRFWDGDDAYKLPEVKSVGSPIAIPETAVLEKDGFEFLGWARSRYDEAPQYQPGDSVTPQKLLTELHAVWKAIVYSITYDYDGGRASGNPISYSAGSSTITLNNPVKDGCDFVGWTGTDLEEPTKTVKIPQGSTGDRHYKANWNKPGEYELVVEMPTAYTDARQKTSKVTDKNFNEGVSGMLWVPTEEDLDSMINHDISFSGVGGLFMPGETYYSYALVEIPDGMTSDDLHVSLAEAEGVAQVGDLFTWNGYVGIGFKVTIPAVTVTVEFGEGHGDSAASAAAASEDVPMTVEGTTLTYKAQKGADRWYDVTSPIRSALYGIPHEENGEQLFNGFVYYNLKPLSDYADEDAWQADFEILQETTPQNEDLKLYVQWAKPTTASLAVTPPVCGTEVTFNSDPEQGEPGSSPAPEISVTDGKAAPAMGTWVVLDSDDRPTDTFAGTMVGGETYHAQLMVGADFGYFIPDEEDAVTVEGGEVVTRSYAGVTILILAVEAEHEWGEWVTTEAPTAVKEGVETRTCKHCPAAETRPLDKVLYTLDITGVEQTGRNAGKHVRTVVSVRDPDGNVPADLGSAASTPYVARVHYIGVTDPSFSTWCSDMNWQSGGRAYATLGAALTGSASGTEYRVEAYLGDVEADWARITDIVSATVTMITPELTFETTPVSEGQSDGTIAVSGAQDQTIKYYKDGETIEDAVEVSGTEITGLAAGKYHVFTEMSSRKDSDDSYTFFSRSSVYEVEIETGVKVSVIPTSVDGAFAEAEPVTMIVRNGTALSDIFTDAKTNEIGEGFAKDGYSFYAVSLKDWSELGESTDELARARVGEHGTDTVTEDTDFYAIMAIDIPAVDCKIAGVSCKTETDTPKTGDSWDWPEQTNKPEVTVNGTPEGYTFDQASWRAGTGTSDPEPYIGVIDEETTAYAAFNAAWGYQFATEPEVTVDGATFSSMETIAPYGDYREQLAVYAKGVSLSHDWGEWKVTVKATTSKEGKKQRICSVCGAAETKAIPKLAPAKVSGILLAKMKYKGKTGMTITWNKVKGVKGYDVFFGVCNEKDGTAGMKKIKTVKAGKTLKVTRTGLKKSKAYKVIVKAYVVKNGKKSYVRTSPTVHEYTNGGIKKYTNAKSVTVKKAKVSLKKGKTYKIKASVNRLKKSKKLMPAGHAAKLRYVSSNKKVATVSAAGKIKAKAKGSCKIYVLAHNGVKKTVSVTVR